MNDPTASDDMKRSAPTLFGLPKTDPFVVPEGFFDRFPHEVQGLLTARRPNDGLRSVWKRVAMALPVVALLGLGSWWALRPAQLPMPVYSIATAPLNDGELDQLNDDELLALTEDVSPLADPAEAMGQVEIQLNDDELIAYLDGAGVDYNELIPTE